MFAIGIRATPKKVIFAIYDTDAQSIITVDEIKVPAAFATPDALKYVRSNLLDILREYDVETAGVRTTEPNAQSTNITRIQIEGVILEAFASSALKSYYIGHVSSISARLKMDRKDFKPMIDGDKIPAVENWLDLKREQREAVLCAMGAEHA